MPLRDEPDRGLLVDLAWYVKQPCELLIQREAVISNAVGMASRGLVET